MEQTAGQTLLLQGQRKDAASGAFTQIGVELQLQVGAVRGFGATGEVYNVTVLQHDGPGPAGAVGAAAPQTLVGKELCLKVYRFFSCVQPILQQKLYGDAEAFLKDMRANLLQHHSIRQQCGDTSFIMGSYVFGSIYGVEGAQVPALLMDRAEHGCVAQQLQQGRRPGLG